ncbi:MAG TPA: HEAT repeat domain-containing protein [Kofleriaceae bacterium]|nr:HEAT repeat domain-containing protein [Kofleriaceae bacterium]
MTGSQNCPSCGNALDPMHAPVARIRGGKVVSFCSAACAAAGPGDDAERRPRSAMPALPRPPGEALVSPAPQAARVTARPEAEVEPRRSRRMPSSREYLEVEEEPAPRRRGRGLILVVCILVLAGGVVLLASEMVPLRGEVAVDESQERVVGAAARRPPITGAARAGGPAVPAVDAKTAVAGDSASRKDAAMTELRALMTSSSPRARRLAAQALARTGDQPALAELRKLAREEPSQLGRIQIAYALARAGDRPARETLRGQLGAERRDVRLDAARSLVQLGDDSGRKALRAMLSVEQHRVGAAGLLARLGDDEGLKMLRAEVADKRATPEAKMRAQVALGRAGDASVKGALQKILSDKRYNVGAADALAALGDEAAGPALTVQLGLSAMRVQAALWLRRMKKEVDLEPLFLALQAGDEASRVSAAEALLILTGPAGLAERD